MTVHLSSAFIAAYKKHTKRHPILREKIQQTIQRIRENPRHPSLRLHKLTGSKHQTWSVSVDRDIRILFSYVENGVLLIDVGTHDEVY